MINSMDLYGPSLALIGAVIGAAVVIINGWITAIAKSSDTAKDILTRTVTDERAKWRSELRDAVAIYVEFALLVALDEADKNIPELNRLRVLIRLRLNPSPEESHDAELLKLLPKILVAAQDSILTDLYPLLEVFEDTAQQLLKKEWDKSKDEAVSGQLVRKFQ